MQERKLEKFFEIARPHESYLAVIMVLLFSASFCKFFNIIKTRKRVQHNKQLFQRNKIFLSCFSKIKNWLTTELLKTDYLAVIKTNFTELPSIILMFKFLWYPWQQSWSTMLYNKVIRQCSYYPFNFKCVCVCMCVCVCVCV